MEDIKIKCQDCKKEFVFTSQEQKFYEDKNLVPPKRCYSCRQLKKRKEAKPLWQLEKRKKK